MVDIGAKLVPNVVPKTRQLLNSSFLHSFIPRTTTTTTTTTTLPCALTSYPPPTQFRIQTNKQTKGNKQFFVTENRAEINNTNTIMRRETRPYVTFTKLQLKKPQTISRHYCIFQSLMRFSTSPVAMQPSFDK